MVITFGGQTDEHSIVDTWTHEQGQDVINHIVAIIEHLKYMATDTLNCRADLTFGSQVNKIDVMGVKENEQKHDIFNKPIAPVDRTKYTKTETFDCKTDIDFDNLNNSVCADAAAAIAVTYRGTNAFNTVKNYAGVDWGSATKIFETDIRTDSFSKFSISRILGMVGWQNAQ